MLVVGAIISPLVLLLADSSDDRLALTTRYLVLVPIALVVLAAIAADRVRGRSGQRAAVVLAAAVVAAGLVVNVNLWSSGPGSRLDAPFERLASAAREQGWDRVYASIWTGVIADQVERGGPRWVTVDCDAGTPLELFEWNNDDATLRYAVSHAA